MGWIVYIQIKCQHFCKNNVDISKSDSYTICEPQRTSACCPGSPTSPPITLSTVRDMPLAKLVRDDMLAMILRGELPTGQRINEPDIAARLGVSRVPVREALRELESTGLVVARKHAGVFVREPDAEEVRDLYEMRGLLDGFAGRRAARLDDAARIALADALDASIAAMNAAFAAHDVQRYYRENLQLPLGHRRGRRQPGAGRHLPRRGAEAAPLAPEESFAGHGHARLDRRARGDRPRAARGRRRPLRKADGAPRRRRLRPAVGPDGLTHRFKNKETRP